MGSTNALGLLFYSKFVQINCPKSLSWVTSYISLSRMINFKKVHQLSVEIGEKFRLGYEIGSVEGFGD